MTGVTNAFRKFQGSPGELNAAQKEEIIHKTTDLFAHYFGEGVRPYTMVLVDEVVDGGWGRADETFPMAKMIALVTGSNFSRHSVHDLGTFRAQFTILEQTRQA
jgi:4-oxalocrotonate tautomerase